MAEVVGLAFAVVGVVSQVMELTDFISSTITNSKHYESDTDILRIKFEHEHQHVKSLLKFLFGEDLLAKEGVFNTLPDDSKVNILEIIFHLCEGLNSYTAIETKYGLGNSKLSGGPDLRDILQSKSSGSKRSQEKSTSFLTKLRWAVSGKSMLERLINDLHGWNKMISRVIKDVAFMQMRLVTDIEKIEDKPATNASGMGPSVKLRRLMVSQEITKTLEIKSYARLLNLPDGKKSKNTPRGESGGRQIAQLKATPTDKDGDPVIVEYKQYDEGQDSDPVVVNRVQKLAALLHNQDDAGFRVLPCRGYFNDLGGFKFGFIFNIPKGVYPAPISLQEALSRPEGRSKRPSVTLRLKIAYKLAESLYLLHTVGWVHKSLRSENILFFEPNDASDNPNLMYESPWLAGFEYSRVESDFSSRRLDERLDTNLYRHPKRWGRPLESSTKIHDIYSLGVILLEIGFWCGVQSFHKDKFDSFRLNPSGVADHLRNFALGRTGYSMGEKYEKIVRMCLEGDVSAFGVENDDKTDTILQKQFREQVVEVLEAASQSV